MFPLKPFQEDAVVKLVDQVKKLVHSKFDNTQLVFKSGTGSGKTIMTAEAFKRLDKEATTDDCVYIWASIQGLHIQSHEKLSKYLRGTGYNLVIADKYVDFTDAELPAKTILFVNWEKVNSVDKETGEWSNILVRENESGKNIVNVLDATKAAGRKIVLVVDEAHATYLGPKSQRFVNEVIQPKLTLEISATPSLEPSARDVVQGSAGWIEVPFSEVAASGLIKEQTCINYQIGQQNSQTPNEMILQAAIDRRDALVRLYDANSKTKVNPLVLIQLPSDASKTSTLDASIREEVETYLENQGITYDNGKLAIWLSEAKNKKNLEDIEALDNEVEYLIFKQAIATGWDCPRACILVMFREIKSTTFKLQTVGRILRMPEANHYSEKDLNQAYVFTNIDGVEIDPESNDSQIHFKLETSTLKAGISNIDIPNVYFHRTDYNDLTSEFSTLLLKKLTAFFELSPLDPKRKEKIASKLETNTDKLTQPMVTDIVIENLDEIDNEIVSETIEVELDSSEIEKIFMLILKSWTSPYNYTRSVGRLKPALYRWFKQAGISTAEVQRMIACSKKNQEILGAIISEAKSEFEDNRHATIASKRSRTDLRFKLPQTDSFSCTFRVQPAEKHALEPYYVENKQPQTEVRFEEYLENCKQVEWWYKNGVKQKHYFAVPYNRLNEETNIETPAGFYPDYIVHYVSGNYGIYDTKNGITLISEDTKRKAEALQDYLINTLKDPAFRGGIIDARNDGSFHLSTSSTYDPGDSSQWSVFAPF